MTDGHVCTLNVINDDQFTFLSPKKVIVYLSGVLCTRFNKDSEFQLNSIRNIMQPTYIHI